jgi:hypothetical protein
MPKARRMILSATFDPEALHTLATLFEEVWASVAPAYGSDPLAIEEARMRLATIVIDLAKDRQLSPLQITRTAARLMSETTGGRV